MHMAIKKLSWGGTFHRKKNKNDSQIVPEKKN